MTIPEIRQLLENPYNQKDWKQFIQTQFTNNKLYGAEQTIQLQANRISKNCVVLGNYEIDEYTKIGIFEIHINDKVNITRNRVALRNILKHITAQVAGAMVVFVQGDKWRFSYISKRKVKNKDTNQIEDKETAPKRYTYLFGKNEKALTAAIRFNKLIQKQKENIFQLLSLHDFEEAFSVEKLSKEFFKQYKETYEDFVQYLTGKRYTKKGNKYAEQIIHEPNWQLKMLFTSQDPDKEARNFCKRMMGRIVFLYFIQKKGWLAVAQNKKWGEGNMNYLYDLFDKSKHKDNFYSIELVPLFFKTLNNPDSENLKNAFRFPYLNGGLFDDAQDKKHNKLQLPEQIFNTLFTTFNNYNFTVNEDAPDEHTVAVDPEMLGHIFENLLEDNKDKGAFYTPKEIVHYMCQESLKEYLLSNEDLHIKDDSIGKSTIAKIIQQVELNDEEQQFAEHNAYKIIDALERVKICDPAIGSGAFPMGLLQEIFNAQIYLQELKGFKKGITDAQIKKHIIEESIYGVDIDAGAVDIARLRFWLSLVVDEEMPQPLPNLDFKIVCANTLIPLGEIKNNDFGGAKDIADELANVRHQYFNASSKEKKLLEKKFNDLQIKLLKTAKDWVSKEDAEVYQRLLDFSPFEDKSCSWFDAWWMFGLPKENGRLNSTGGYFDIVIGNPPYVKEYTNKSAFKNIPYYQGKMDLWYSFACIGIDLLKESGILSFIATNNWVTNSGALIMRNKVINDTKILKLVDFGSYMIFENASIQTMVMLFQKNNIVDNYPFELNKIVTEKASFNDILDVFNSLKTNNNEFLTPTIERIDFTNKSLTFSESVVEEILNKIKVKQNFVLNGKKEIAQGIVYPQDYLNKKNSTILGSNFKVGQGIFALSEKEKEDLSINAKELELIKPYFTTRQIHKWYALPENTEWIIYTDHVLKIRKT